MPEPQEPASRPHTTRYTRNGYATCSAFTRAGKPCQAPATSTGLCRVHSATQREWEDRRQAVAAVQALTPIPTSDTVGQVISSGLIAPGQFRERVRRRMEGGRDAILDPRLELATLEVVLEDLQALMDNYSDPLPLQGALTAVARELGRARQSAAAILQRQEQLVTREEHVSTARALAGFATKALDLQRREAATRLRRLMAPGADGVTQPVPWSEVVDVLQEAWNTGIRGYQQAVTDYAVGQGIQEVVGRARQADRGGG